MSQVKVHVYDHPDWGGSLIMEASDDSRSTAEYYVSDNFDLLTMKPALMSREDFDSLPEFDV